MNQVLLVGHLTADIHFRRLPSAQGERPYLRLILMASQPRPLAGVRIVLWDAAAEHYQPCLRRGSEIGVIGELATRRHDGRTILEVAASSLLLLRNTSPPQGAPLPAGASQALVTGTLDRAPDYTLRSRFGGDPAPFLRLSLSSDETLAGLPVILRGSLAALAHPYLRAGSRVAVSGSLRMRPGAAQVHLAAARISFLENIDWENGDRARAQAVPPDGGGGWPLR